jgi:hypothetical protein
MLNEWLNEMLFYKQEISNPSIYSGLAKKKKKKYEAKPQNAYTFTFLSKSSTNVLKYRYLETTVRQQNCFEVTYTVHHDCIIIIHQLCALNCISVHTLVFSPDECRR